MKSVLFVSGVTVTYVTIALMVMRRWVKNIQELDNVNTQDAILLGRSLEQMERGDLVDL